MIDNKVESVKIIGPRDIDLDENIRRLLDYENLSIIFRPPKRTKPFFNDAKEPLKILIRIMRFIMRVHASNNEKNHTSINTIIQFTIFL